MGNLDLSSIKNRQGQSAYDRWVELSGYGLREAFMQRMQSPAYVNGSDGNSWYTASSRANMLREVQHRFQDKAMLQIRREFPEVDAALRTDKQNKLDTKVGKAPRNAMSEVLNFGK